MKNTAKIDETDIYNIWVINNGAAVEIFWCFLQQPEGIAGSKVYGNTDASISAIPNNPSYNSFSVPLQYSIGAGAGNQAVGLNVQINSSNLVNANINDSFSVNYANSPPNDEPSVFLDRTANCSGTIVLNTNNYDEVNNDNFEWYESMSFGIQSEEGFLGFTWKPSPGETTLITPIFSFYIATGLFNANELVDLDTISGSAAKIDLSDFKDFNVTVTLNADGTTWTVTSGMPEYQEDGTDL